MTQSNLKKIYALLKSTYNNGLVGPDRYTHVSMGNNKGQFYLSASDNLEFYEHYSKLVERAVPVCIAEKQNDYVPLLGDIDIKIMSSADINTVYKKTRTLYSNEELFAIVKCFQESIKKNVVEWNEQTLTCVILEKKPYISDGFLKNGFHLHFPFLFVEKVKVKNVLIPKIKEAIRDFKLGNGKPLFKDHTENPDSFLDDVTSKCWLMYGSSKSETYKPYIVSQVLNHDLKPVSLFDAFNAAPFYDKEEELVTVTEENVKELLPQLLSVSSIKKHVFNIKTPIEIKLPSKVYLKQKLKEIEVESSSTIKKNLLDAKNILKLLKLQRADEYSSWWDVGIILFNIGHGCEEAFNIWNKWSAKSDKYDEDACLEKWNYMEHRNQTHRSTKGMGSLRWYAKQDNLRKYNDFVEASHGVCFDSKDIDESIKQLEVLTTDTPLANLLLELYSDEYIFSDGGWYRFNGTIWCPVKVIKDFRLKLEFIAKKYKLIKKMIINALYNEPDDEPDSEDEDDKPAPLTKKHKAILTMKKQEIGKAVNKLENFASQNNIIKMCEVLFYNEDFSELLDENPMLIAFKNGVFDFELLTFRRGLHSDYLSKTLDINYDETLHEEHEEIKNLHVFLNKIFPNKDIRDYFIDQTCEVFRGGNRDKIAMFWTGNGNNGKSVTQRLFETMMGKKLAIKLSTSALTERIQPGQPNPQLTRLRRGVRWGVFDEWGKTEQILSGSLNVLTGGDSLPCRDLFQKGCDTTDFTPMFKMLCICNELPCLKDAVDATWDRIRIIPFESTFVSVQKCPKTEKEQFEKKMFLCDTEMTNKKKLSSLANALGWYLMKHFKIKDEKRRLGTHFIKIPDKVNEAKIKYQTKCDLIAFFMEDTFSRTDNDKNKISFDDMYVSFKSWYLGSFSGKMINLNKHEFSEMIKQKYNLPDGDKKIKGFIYKQHAAEE